MHVVTMRSTRVHTKTMQLNATSRFHEKKILSIAPIRYDLAIVTHD